MFTDGRGCEWLAACRQRRHAKRDGQGEATRAPVCRFGGLSSPALPVAFPRPLAAGQPRSTAVITCTAYPRLSAFHRQQVLRLLMKDSGEVPPPIVSRRAVRYEAMCC